MTYKHQTVQSGGLWWISTGLSLDKKLLEEILLLKYLRLSISAINSQSVKLPV